MTINAGTPRISYSASGSSTDFIFDFPIWAKTDIKVYSNEVLQTVDTDYTVTFTAGSESGGTVSFVSAPTADFVVEIVRRLTVERDSDFATSGPFPMETLNEQMDQITAQGQDQADEIGRALYIPASTAGVSTALPEPVGGEMWRWANDGTSVEAFDTSDLDTTVQASQMIRDTYVDGTDYTAGVTTQLTLTRNPGTEGNTDVYFDGVYQTKTVYAVSGTTVTFADPITAGVALVEIMQIQAAEPQSVSTATTLQFDTSPGAISNVEGLLWWNDTSKTLNIGLEGDVTMQVGQEMPIYVRNESGDAVADGDVVYVSGSTGVHLVVGLADASDVTKCSQIGVVTTAAGIADNGFGFVARFGAVRGLNASGTPVTETWNNGDLLYVSATTPGTLSKTPPGTPHFTAEVGLVVSNSSTQGVIGVDPKQPHASNVALGTSDVVGPTQGAVKAYVDNKPYLAGDGTAGLVLRSVFVSISDGTTGTSVKGAVDDKWNGDTIATTDDITKGATVGSFSLGADGTELSFPVTGSCVGVLAMNVITNGTATEYYATAKVSTTPADGLLVRVRALGSSSASTDLTSIVDVGPLSINVLYLTDA